MNGTSMDKWIMIMDAMDNAIICYNIITIMTIMVQIEYSLNN